MDSFTITQPEHPVVRCVAELTTALDQAEALDPGWLPVPDKQALLITLQTQLHRAQGLLLALLAGSEDVAAEVGARRVCDWWAHQVHADHGPAYSLQRLAETLATRWHQTFAALRAGTVSLDQARVITAALDDLPRHLLPADVLDKAEAFLIDHAAHHTPRELRRIGDHLLEVIAPDLHADTERAKLDRELAKARRTTRLSLKNRGDGSTDLHARIPDSLASRLRTYLDAHTSPRTADPSTGSGADGTDGTGGTGEPDEAGDRGPGCGQTDPGTGERIPIDRLRGHAFCAMLQHLDPATMPLHGGTPTSVVVTTTLDALRSELGVGTLEDGTEIPASEVRRLACNAGIIPAVLGGDSEVLDLGRSSRLYQGHQKRALAIGHPTCRTQGCTVPATWCEAHVRREALIDRAEVRDLRRRPVAAGRLKLGAA